MVGIRGGLFCVTTRLQSKLHCTSMEISSLSRVLFFYARVKTLVSSTLITDNSNTFQWDWQCPKCWPNRFWIDTSSLRTPLPTKQFQSLLLTFLWSLFLGRLGCHVDSSCRNWNRTSSAEGKQNKRKNAVNFEESFLPGKNHLITLNYIIPNARRHTISFWPKYLVSNYSDFATSKFATNKLAHMENDRNFSSSAERDIVKEM